MFSNVFTLRLMSGGALSSVRVETLGCLPDRGANERRYQVALWEVYFEACIHKSQDNLGLLSNDSFLLFCF